MNITKYILIGIVIFAASAISPVSAPRSDTKQDTIPRFEAAACAITIPETEKEHVRCGYLVVPENRNRKDSPLIRLPVIILKSSSPNPAPDPILRTLGGPGASSLRMVRGRQASPWLKDRDVIIFEQRGTRYAQPNLGCPEVDAAKIENAKSNPDKQPAKSREVKAAQACHDRLVKDGIDLTAYNSSQSAADIEDLRRVLGYEKWNLYGVSYSARLMLEVMRDYPDGIRSVVIESVLPLSVNYDEVGVDAVVRALKVLFTNCAADAECSKTYPALENVFYNLVRQANKRSIPVGIKSPDTNEPLTIRLTGNDIANWVVDEMLSAGPDKILAAPSLIYQVASGDSSPLMSYAESKVNPQSFTWGMRYSVWCREEMPFENRRTIAAQSRRYPQLRGFEINAMPAICDVWRVPPAEGKENKPFTSDIPTLILAGEYDAYILPAWGQLMAQTLRHSYFYEVPGVGHGPGFVSGCAIRVVSNFFINPTTAPNHPCLKAPRQRFMTKKQD
jgi:pimeloyl-ACP methyl ester carboxylesterase